LIDIGAGLLKFYARYYELRRRLNDSWSSIQLMVIDEMID